MQTKLPKNLFKKTKIRLLRKRLVRSIVKLKRIIGLCLSTLGCTGSTVCGYGYDNIVYLSLNRNYYIGQRNEIIMIPKDNVIFESLKRFGKWEPQESYFLSEGLRGASGKSSDQIALIDIGANVGLVSIQAMNIAQINCEIFAIEPASVNYQCLKHNLQKFTKDNNVHLYNQALSNYNGRSKIFINKSNFGNSSLIKTDENIDNFRVEEIEVYETKNFFKLRLLEFKSYFLKCDCEGSDAAILSRIPNEIWNRVERAVIEISAHSQISKLDLRKMEVILRKFSKVSWQSNPNDNIDPSQVIKFWGSSTNHHRNLFLVK